MASIVRYPASVDSNENSAWVHFGGGGLSVPDLSDASDSTGALSTASSGDRRELLLNFQPITEVVKVNSGVLTVRWKTDAPGDAAETSKILADVAGFSRQDSGDQTFGDAFENDTFDVTNLAGVSQSVYNSSKFGFENGIHHPTYNGTQVAQFELALDVAYAPGGIVGMIGQWLGPLVAVGLHEMPRLAREIYRLSRGQIRIKRHELERAWRELRAPRRAYLIG